MDNMATLRRSGGIEALARELGIAPTAAAAGVEALLPAIVGGFCKYREGAGGDAGLAEIANMLEKLGGGAMAAAVMGPDAADAGPGNSVLGAIFGSTDINDLVTGYAAQVTGLEPEMLRRMLPLLTMLVGGYLSSRATGSGAEGSGGLPIIGVLIDAECDAATLDGIIAEAGKLRNP